MWPLTLRASLLLVLIFGTLTAEAQKSVLGFWREPGGSVIEVFACGTDVCAKLAAIRKDAPSPFDKHDPDETKRKQPLCGLQIGYGFHLSDAEHAEGGKLYDPKSGKTYQGMMTADGDQLHLRGYVGIKMFGRTETWARTEASAACGVHR